MKYFPAKEHSHAFINITHGVADVTIGTTSTTEVTDEHVTFARQLLDAAAAFLAGTDLVFCTKNGTPLSATNVRRDFRKVIVDAGLVGVEWTPRELRHSFVSLLSDSGVPIEDISRLVGHANTVVTETVYRFQVRPVLLQGAEAMDGIFPAAGES
ncbi:site-specific integrase [Nonomuraea cypriaca]|uniref:site-specific integrase n=1 Tax=Nonomuraea cypriaca TaxID=1187855 RepID=UPI002E2A758C|nr:tyrosine-type recombinase/integrase [Nonomuraea cypriaca]